jgi:hypothetical protein
MKRYTEPEMEIVSFEINDVTNNDSRFGDNDASADPGFWPDGDSNQVNW